MQQEWKEPEYKIRPTWKLAWGILWRMWALCIPFYIVIKLLELIGK